MPAATDERSEMQIENDNRMRRRKKENDFVPPKDTVEGMAVMVHVKGTSQEQLATIAQIGVRKVTVVTSANLKVTDIAHESDPINQNKDKNDSINGTWRYTEEYVKRKDSHRKMMQKFDDQAAAMERINKRLSALERSGKSTAASKKD